MGEVETDLERSDEGALRFDLGTENLSKCREEDVGSGVIDADRSSASLSKSATCHGPAADLPRISTHLVIAGFDLISDFEVAVLHAPHMQDIPLVHLHILHLEGPSLR